MFKKRSVHGISSLKTALFFISLVVVILVVAISIKVIETIQKSIFDGQHQFVILLESPNNKATLVDIDPSDTIFSALYINNPKHETIQSDIPLGIDAIVQTSQAINSIQDVQTALLVSASFMNLRKNSDITWYDLLRLWYVTKTVNKSKIIEDHITLPANETDLASAEKLFIDAGLEKESAPIQIINATDISGEATRLETLLTNIGCSVIDVRTSTTTQSSSMILYYGTITYTVQKLQRVLGYPIQQTHQQMIGAVQIVIGEDGNRLAKF